LFPNIRFLFRGKNFQSKVLNGFSDAMSGFGKHDMESHNQDVKDATAFLHEKLIPNFANALESMDLSKLKLLTELMHREGINIRHLVLFFIICS
jgi:hypothetical protein